MIIDRVSYKKIFPLAPYINEQIGVEIQLSETDQPGDALDAAKRIVEEWHRESNSLLPPLPSNGQVPEIQVKDIKALERIEDFFHDHSNLITADQKKIFERVIQNREVSSYKKLINIIDGLNEQSNKKRKL